MSGSPATPPEQVHTDADTWPWRCLGCGETIYHDGEYCRQCMRSRWHGVDRHADAPDGFLEWMRRESVSTFSVKVATISGVELLLTTIWLQLLVGGVLGIG